MARNRSTRIVRKAKNLVWTAMLINIDVDTGATPLETNIVQATDWTGKVGFSRATVEAIRGYVFVSGLTNVATPRESRAVIVKDSVEATAVAANPALLGTYVDEDVLWTGGVRSAGLLVGHYIEISVKTKRKITVDDNIKFIVSEEAAASPNGTTYWGILRALINVNS